MNIPRPPKFSLLILGPGIVLIAMGLGSGEFILWPSLVAKYGFGVIWGAIIGITFQYFVSNETGRYSIATGGSVFEGFYKLNKYIPLWFIVSTFLSFAWPGIIGSGGEILGELIGFENHKWLTISMLLVMGIMLTFGGKVYSKLELIQKIFVGISIPILLYIAIRIFSIDATIELAKGTIGIGDGYLFLPAGISIGIFLGSVAYSGAAGNLVASHSFYVQDKGLGMAKNLNTQIDTKNKIAGVPKGLEFDAKNNDNIKHFRGWFALSAKEQFISFWGFGLVTIFLLAYISFVLVYPFSGSSDLDFIYLQESGIASTLGANTGIIFILIGIVFLFTTQLGILESTSRIMSENTQLLSSKISTRFSRSNIFFFFLWAQIIFGSVISFMEFSQPTTLLFLATFFSAISMLVLSFLILKLNTNVKILPDIIHPSNFRKFVLILSVLFFGVFVCITLIDLI